MSASPPPEHQSAILALVAALDQAASARDIDRFLGLFADSADFAFGFNGALRTSRQDVRDFHQAAWAGVRELAFHTSVEHIAIPAPGFATLCATGCSTRTLAGGERTRGTYALMLALVHAPQGWRVLQAHESTGAPPVVLAVGD